MKMRVFAAVAVAIPLAFGTSRLIAQGNSDVHVPDSSIEKPGERGHKAHTNHVIALRGASPTPRLTRVRCQFGCKVRREA